MKKELIIEVEEECLVCPHLSLVTRKCGSYADGKPFKIHECEHLDFCRDVRKAWEMRKKGRWIKENIVLTSNPPQYQWHCSECGRLIHWFSAEVLTDFCPNCGAEMEASAI